MLPVGIVRKAELGRERKNKPTTGIAADLESAETNPLRCLPAWLKNTKTKPFGRSGEGIA
jgi:hypothetical protein